MDVLFAELITRIHMSLFDLDQSTAEALLEQL
jgi:hypothetical protein